MFGGPKTTLWIGRLQCWGQSLEKNLSSLAVTPGHEVSPLDHSLTEMMTPPFQNGSLKISEQF